MRLAFSLLIIIHGLIHMLGVLKAYEIADIEELKEPISKASGILWFICFILFLSGAAMVFLKLEWWGMVALSAVVISQTLILRSWRDAKWGTIPNILILAVVIGEYLY